MLSRNELHWEYHFDSVTGRMSVKRHDPKPEYALRCFVLTRVARQFHYHARFDASRPPVDDATYLRLLRKILGSNPRKPSTAERRVVIPGWASLREFSAAREKLLKANCGGAWRSYVLRSHWRMVFPISRRHQQQTSASLLAGVREGFSPIIHLVTFPALTMNHGMIIFDARETPTGIEFSAYDPNDPSQPSRLTFDSATRTFSLPANRYWGGGQLNIIEIFRGWLM